MTNKEYSELLRKKEELSNKIKEAYQNNQELVNQLYQVNNAIEEEEFRRDTTANFDEHYSIIKNMLDAYEAPRQSKDQLWSVEINGKRYSTHKGKHTWTSKKRAETAIFDYLCDLKNKYYRYADVNVNIDGILNKFIEEGVIVIKQIL